MKKLLCLMFFYFLLNSYNFAQNSELTESQKLNQQVSDLYQQGKFVEAIPIAEKIVQIERKQNKVDLQNLITALSNLVTLKKLHRESVREKTRFLDKDKKEIPEIRIQDLKKTTSSRSKLTDSISELFQEIIQIYEKDLKIENIKLAEIKAEYASYLTSKGMFVGSGYLEAKKIEELYSDSLKLKKKFLGENDNLTLSTVLQLANFYQNEADFEKSIPLYQNYISQIENKYGNDSQYLLSALRIYLAILGAIDLKDEALTIQMQISNITKQPEKMPEYNLDLTLRNMVNKSNELLMDTGTITSYLKKEKFLMVEVLIDEKGNVIETNPTDTKDIDIHKKKVKEFAKKEVLKWKFYPFHFNGTAKKVKGIVWFPYFVKA